MGEVCADCVDFMQRKEALEAIVSEEEKDVVSVVYVSKTDERRLRATPLIHALSVGHFSCMKALISAGADVNENDTTGTTPLIKSSIGGQTECVQILISSGADVNKSGKHEQTPVISATYIGSAECLKTLISAGADVNQSDDRGCSPVIAASIEGENECVNILVTAGANVNCRNIFGESALHFAVKKNNISLVKTLISAGADVNAANDVGESALHYAILENNVSLVKTVISAGADVNQTNHKGWTPLLELSSFTDGTGCLDALVAGGADVNSTNEDGETALHFAVSRGKFPLFCHLLRAGADANMVDVKGNTPLSCLSVFAAPYACELLFSGAKVNITTPNSLQRCIRNHRSVSKYTCKLLLAAGENTDATSDEVHSALYSLGPREIGQLGLKHLCREAIRKHLLQMSNVNLFVRVPLLGLPSLLTEYLLYNVECDSMMKTKRVTTNSDNLEFP